MQVLLLHWVDKILWSFADFKGTLPFVRNPQMKQSIMQLEEMDKLEEKNGFGLPGTKKGSARLRRQ